MHMCTKGCHFSALFQWLYFIICWTWHLATVWANIEVWTPEKALLALFFFPLESNKNPPQNPLLFAGSTKHALAPNHSKQRQCHWGTGRVDQAYCTIYHTPAACRLLCTQACHLAQKDGRESQWGPQGQIVPLAKRVGRMICTWVGSAAVMMESLSCRRQQTGYKAKVSEWCDC